MRPLDWTAPPDLRALIWAIGLALSANSSGSGRNSISGRDTGPSLVLTTLTVVFLLNDSGGAALEAVRPNIAAYEAGQPSPLLDQIIVSYRDEAKELYGEDAEKNLLDDQIVDHITEVIDHLEGVE